MRKFIALLLLCSISLSACRFVSGEKSSVSETQKASSQNNGTNGEEEASPIQQKKLDMEITYEDEIVKEFPKWFDKKGHFTYSKLVKSTAWEKVKNVPEKLLNEMSTEEILIDVIFRSPYLKRFTGYETVEQAMDAFLTNWSISSMRGMQAFLEREDSLEVLLSFFHKENLPSALDPDHPYDKKHDYLYMYYFETWILSRSENFQSLRAEQRQYVVENAEACDAEICKVAKNKVSPPVEDYGTFQYLISLEAGNPWQEEFAKK